MSNYVRPSPPEITDERLAELVDHIKPVVVRNGGPFYIEEVDPRGIAFTWDPRVTMEAKGLVPLDVIVTVHSYGAPAFFKPSIAEVLAQIPEHLISQVVAFSTEVHPDQFTADSEMHVAETTLYRRA